MGFENAVTSPRNYHDTVTLVREALADQGFGVLTEIDVQATMERKLGESYPPFLILGACNPPLAHRALQAEATIGTLLPCNVVVRESEGEVLVEALDPQMMVELTQIEALSAVADEAGERLAKVLAVVAGSA